MLNKYYQTYMGIADFICVYIEEAHAVDIWPLGREVSIVASHKCLQDRLAAARRLKAFGLEMPTYVDSMENAFMNIYAAWPERYYIFHKNLMAYIAQPKRAAYCPAEIRLWLSIYQQFGMDKKLSSRKQPEKAPRPLFNCEQDFIEAEAGIMDLYSEYAIYQDQTSMLDEFYETDSDMDEEQREEIRARRREMEEEMLSEDD